MITRLAAIFAVLVAAIAVTIFGINQSSTAGHSSGPVDKVTVCHATSSTHHPYSRISIPASQIVLGYGHGAHGGDVWASFQVEINGVVITVPSQGDQSVLPNCHVPQGSPTPTASPSPTAAPGVPCPPPNLLNIIRGTRGNDTLVGTACRDLMVSHKGNDALFGLGGGDFQLGGRGKDLLVGGADNDSLRGGFGNDRLIGGEGRDIMRGGPGRDVCIGSRAEDRFIRCERIRVG